jgi:hypothetical protein
LKFLNNIIKRRSGGRVLCNRPPFVGLFHRGAAISKTVVSYVRVSTARQGRSGLGLETQRAAIARFCAAQGYTLTAEYIEIESGKGADALERRPKLDAAIKAARKIKERLSAS